MLRVELPSAGSVHWSIDGWRRSHDTPAVDSGLGIYYVDLDTVGLVADDEVVFTIYWPSEDRWEGRDYTLLVS